MEYTPVPPLSILCIVITLLMGIAIPVALFWFMRKKLGCDRLPFWIGCAVMLLFAFLLEQIAHMLILNSTVGITIRSKTWIYYLYGGLMAGLFEESGRYLAFRTVLRKRLGNDRNALMYGAGHGGFEAFMLLFFTMLNNLIYSIQINTGNGAALLGGLSGAELTAMRSTMEQLAAMNPAIFLLSVLERCFAIAAQISLSVLVWFAAKKGGKHFFLYPLAVLLHLLLDAGALAVSAALGNVLLAELVVMLSSAVCVACAILVWKKNAGHGQLAGEEPRH